MRYLLISIIIGLITLKSVAQQIPMFSNYRSTILSFNPAYAGSKDVGALNILNRNQWVGFKGSPNTQGINFHAPIKYRNVGIGLALLNDQIGPLKSTSINFNFAYKIKVSNQGKLALGIRGGGAFFMGDLSSLSTIEENDPLLIGTSTTSFLHNFGTGLYYQDNKSYFGVSVLNMLEHQRTISNVLPFYSLNRHFFISGGSRLDVSDNIQFIPSFLTKYVVNAPIEIELTTLVEFKERYSLGVAYRVTDAWVLLMGLQLNKKINLNYSYDWSFSNSTFKYNQGSHEVLLSFDIPARKKIEIVTPRFL